MATRLIGSRLKLARAKEHLDNLEETINRFLQENHYAAVSNFDAHMNAYVVKATVSAPTEGRWSSIIGDFTHNARSALDQAVSFFDLANGGSANKTSFPIFLEPNHFSKRRQAEYLGSLANSKDFLDAVIAEQPYTSSPANPAADFLAILADLNNTDKHRTIQTTGGAVGLEKTSLLSVSDPTAIGKIETHIITTRMEHNSPLALVYIEFLKDATVELEFEGTFQITFYEGSDRAVGMGVLRTLRAIHERATDIVTKFENKF